MLTIFRVSAQVLFIYRYISILKVICSIAASIGLTVDPVGFDTSYATSEMFEVNKPGALLAERDVLTLNAPMHVQPKYTSFCA